MQETKAKAVIEEGLHTYKLVDVWRSSYPTSNTFTCGQIIPKSLD